MTAQDLLDNFLLLGRLKLYGLTDMHEQRFDGRGIKVRFIDVYVNEHGTNTESNTKEPPVNGQMFGTGPGCILSRYELPERFDVDDIIKALKECIVDEIDIVNMSIGLYEDYQQLERQVQECDENNILMIAAAGNKGNEFADHVDIKLWPEEYKEVISAGSVDSDLGWSSFESHGKSIDLVGIGRSAVVKMKDGSYEFGQGTSFSAPQITGLFASVWSMFRQQGQNPPVEDIKQYVFNRCVDLGSEGKDNFYGRGIPTMDINEFKETRRLLGIVTKTITLQINNNIMLVDGEVQVLDTKPIIDENNRTLVPLRAIAEALGCKVEWKADTQTIIIIE